MFEEIDPRSPTPLYEQIAQRIRLAIASGEVKPGDSLPSVRRLASEIRVNPATVVQAYRDLETDGFVSMRHGAGTFVNDLSSEERSEERRAQAHQLVRKALEDAARLGITAAELAAAFEEEVGVTTGTEEAGP